MGKQASQHVPELGPLFVPGSKTEKERRHTMTTTPNLDPPRAPGAADSFSLSHDDETAHAVQWSAETWFIGALLWAPLDLARKVLALVVARDFDEPKARLVLSLAKDAVAAGRNPDAAAITAGGNETGAAASKARSAQLMAYLSKPLDLAPPASNLARYAGDVLRARERDSFRDLGEIMGEMSESAPLNDLRDALNGWLSTQRDRAQRCAALDEL